MRSNLRFEEKPGKWKVLEQPLKELCKIFQEAEAYIKNCFGSRDWWAKALILYNNRDCVEFHIHNLLTSESGSEGASISGDDVTTTADDIFLSAVEKKNPVPQEPASSTDRQNLILHDPIPVIIDKKQRVTREPLKRRLSLPKILPSAETKAERSRETTNGRSTRPPQVARSSRGLSVTPDNKVRPTSSRIRRRSGHASDSELP